MRVSFVRLFYLFAAVSLTGVPASASPLDYWHRITVQHVEMAAPSTSFQTLLIPELPSQTLTSATAYRLWFGLYNFAEREQIAGFFWHQQNELDHSRHEKPAATPEPGYEWALGLLLVGMGCASRLRRN